MTTRNKRNQVGDWVAVPVSGYQPGAQRPAKILEVHEDETTDTVAILVQLRFGSETRRLWFEGPCPRIQWRRQAGRSTWSVL